MDLLLQGKAPSLASSPNGSVSLTSIAERSIERWPGWPMSTTSRLTIGPRFALRCESRFSIFTCSNKELVFLIDGNNPQTHLRDERVNRTVSAISAIAEVREFLVAHLREFLTWDNLVMEGRDIGSMVFPDTPYKFYIDASLEVRAQRRAAQGQRDDLFFRDRADSSRRASPLTIAEDAHVIDSSSLTIDGVVGEIIGRLKIERLPEALRLDS